MKLPERIPLIAVLSMMLTVVLSSGCGEKGCTDKSALNYNSVARRDDGSCIYCEHEHQQLGDAYYNLVDYNYNSSYYDETVARFNVTQISDKYNYSTCGTTECKIYYQIENLTNQGMSFTYRFSSNGSVDFSTNYITISIP